MSGYSFSRKRDGIDTVVAADVNELQVAIEALSVLPYFDVVAYGAVGDGVTDDTAAIQGAIDAADAAGGYAVATGTFKVTDTITSLGHLDFQYATFNFDGDAASVGIDYGSASAITREKVVLLPRITNTGKPTTGWDANGVGIKITNAYACHVTVPYVKGFETGLWCHADSALGTEHCQFYLGTLIDNKRNLLILPSNTDLYSYVNENKFYGGNFAHSAAERSAGPTWYQVGARHITIEEGAEELVAVRTATGGTTSTLVDSGATGTANQYAGRRIRITGGTGSGQSRIISSHGAGPGITFTMSSAWTTAPDATSTYVIESYARTNGNRFFGPSLQGDVCEYHVDFQSAHQCSIQEARYETHQPGTVLPKIRFTGPWTTENRVQWGYDLDLTAFTESNGAQLNAVLSERWSWLKGTTKGALTLQNDSSSATGSLFVVPAGTALSADPTSVYTTSIASTAVNFKATGDTQPRMQVAPSTGRTLWGPGGSTAPNAGLEWVATDLLQTVSGDSFLVNGAIWSTAIVAKTATYTAVQTDNVILCDATSGAITINLPAANGTRNTGKVYTIKKTDSSGNAVTVDPNGTQTIDGALTYALASQYKYVTIISDGANWHVIANN